MRRHRWLGLRHCGRWQCLKGIVALKVSPTTHVLGIISCNVHHCLLFQFVANDIVVLEVLTVLLIARPFIHASGTNAFEVSIKLRGFPLMLAAFHSC